MKDILPNGVSVFFCEFSQHKLSWVLRSRVRRKSIYHNLPENYFWPRTDDVVANSCCQFGVSGSLAEGRVKAGQIWQPLSR